MLIKRGLLQSSTRWTFKKQEAGGLEKIVFIVLSDILSY